MKHNSDFNLLIVDDEKFNIEIVAAYLKEEEYKLFFALNAQAVMQTIRKQSIDLILLDINMPDIDGFKICTLLKSNLKTKDIPIIFLTAHNDVDYISRAFAVGGVDYINKPFNAIELLARVKTHLQNKIYLEDIKDKQSKLAQLSITDSLTQLHNTLFFEAQIKSKLANNKAFWVIFIKINNFDKINNLYGFDTSNKLIKKFSQLLKDACISKSIVAKLYGVHFAMLIKDYDKKTILNIKTQLFKSHLASKELYKILNYSIAILHVKKPISLNHIYKNLQNSLKNSKDEY